MSDDNQMQFFVVYYHNDNKLTLKNLVVTCQFDNLMNTIKNQYVSFCLYSIFISQLH